MVLSFQDVEFGYPNQVLFTNLNMDIKEGEFVFLIGKSGAGKTTLLQLIYMNIFPQSGIVTVAEYDSKTIRKKDLPYLRRKVGIVFQDFKLLEDRTVFENLAFVLEVTSTPSKEIKRKVNNALSDVGLSHKRTNRAGELSGGEKQRVAIARATLNDPVLILADEPTGNLDPDTSKEIVEILKKINNRGTAILFATHNYDIVKKESGRIVKIDDGKAYKAVIKSKT